MYVCVKGDSYVCACVHVITGRGGHVLRLAIVLGLGSIKLRVQGLVVSVRV